MVINQLENDWPNRDIKIDPRDILLRIDAVVNSMAKENYFENWKFGGSIDEQFITTWEDLSVTDPGTLIPSYFDLPANYVALPNNAGIDEIYTMKKPMSIPILSATDMRLYKNNPAGNLEGRPGFYPVGTRMKCTRDRFGAIFGKIGLRLVIRDSSAIGSNDPYPIPADMEEEVIKRVVMWFKDKRDQPTDRVRDLNDQA